MAATTASWTTIPVALVLAAICCCCGGGVSSQDVGAVTRPRVRVESGELAGAVDRTIGAAGRPMYAFLGVPYASPPVHKNRFKEPQPVKPWVGVWNATIPGSNCIGLNHNTFSVVGQEDCLYLNVYTPKPWKYNPFTTFGPSVEVAGTERFLTDLPENLPAQDVPILFSFTQDDGLYPSAELVSLDETLSEMESKWDDVLPFLLDYNHTVSDESLKPDIARRIKTFYFGNDTVSASTKNGVVAMTSDRMFKEPVARAARHLASKNTSPVYFYEFGYRGKYSLSNKYSKTGNSEGLGVSHGDDTMYVIKTQYGNPHDNVEDAKLIPVMVNMWLSFAKTGTPDIGNTAVWTPVSKNPADPLKLIKITQKQTFEPQELSDPGNYTFWSSLPLTEFSAANLLNTVSHNEL